MYFPFYKAYCTNGLSVQWVTCWLGFHLRHGNNCYSLNYVHNFLVDTLGVSYFSHSEIIETCDMKHYSQTFQPLWMLFLPSCGSIWHPISLGTQQILNGFFLMTDWKIQTLISSSNFQQSMLLLCSLMFEFKQVCLPVLLFFWFVFGSLKCCNKQHKKISNNQTGLFSKSVIIVDNCLVLQSSWQQLL